MLFEVFYTIEIGDKISIVDERWLTVIGYGWWDGQRWCLASSRYEANGVEVVSQLGWPITFYVPKDMILGIRNNFEDYSVEDAEYEWKRDGRKT